MYLRRKVDLFLAHWKSNERHKPLIISGPRQVGKTASILHFAQANYTHIIYINFVEEPKYKMITVDGYSEEDIIKNITRIDPNKVFIPQKTILIFDEIQDFPDIATSLKFFKLKGNYDVILSGSMLGLNYKKIESNSVGYKEDYLMSSMDFEEFLWAKGYDSPLSEDMLHHMIHHIPFNSLELDLYQNLFLDYCILGGMPEVVCTYITQKDFSSSLTIQRQLLKDYEEDIRKYLSGLEQMKVLSIFRSVPVQLAKENKKFQITKVAKGARLSRYLDAIEWLRDTGIIMLCYCLHLPELPLRGNYDDSKFKLYFCDTGLLVATLDEESQDDLRANKNLGIYKGALYENIVAEALHKSGAPLYYYKRENATLEEDFFLRTANELIPVEVKAKNGRSQSLNALIQNDNYSDIHEGIKLIKGNIGFANQIHTFPYFCAFLLKRYLKER